MALTAQSNVRLTEEQKRYLESLTSTIPPWERERPKFEATISDAIRQVIDRARATEPVDMSCGHNARRFTEVGGGAVSEVCTRCHRVIRWWSKEEWAAREGPK